MRSLAIRALLVLPLLAATCVFVDAGAQDESAGVDSQSFSLRVPASQAWTDTRIEVQPGDKLQIFALPGEGGCSPEGLKNEYDRDLPVAGAAPGALIGRVGKDASTSFAIGAKKDWKAPKAGRLYMSANTTGMSDCGGNFEVTIRLTAAPPAAAGNGAAPAAPVDSKAKSAAAAEPTAASANAPATPAEPSVQQKLANAAQVWLSGQFGKPGTTAAPAPGSSAAVTGGTPAEPAASAIVPLAVASQPLDSALCRSLDSLPRRVNDALKNQGDMVNFVLVGSQKQVEDSLEASGWHLADRDVKEAGLKAILDAYQKKDYLQMPMSDLMLFDRIQDFGFEQAEAYAVVASRHHFRIWKAPFQFQGQDVWVGAGTHDIGFEKDQRNGKVTHKIDPSVDAERDHIGQTLQQSKHTKSLSYYLPPNPVQTASNATGGDYHSDGRLLVVFLQ